MMTSPDAFDGHDAGYSAGMQLRNAREAAGLTLEEAAQHLKLAPRQVKALEDEEFGLLPGRTFTRGFVRNYARLLALDADALVSLLPDATRAPALESPALHPTSTIMGEIPSAARNKPGSSRWLIPLVLIAIIGAAAGYEWFRSSRPGAESRRADASAESSSTASPALAPPSAAVVPAGSAGSTATGTAPPASAASSPAGDPGTPATGSAAAGMTATTLPNPLANAQPPAAVEPPLTITYRATAWTEIRDGTGHVVFARTVPANSVERIDVLPPFEMTIGNASMVTVSYRGVPVDISPYVRANIAHLMLK